MQMNRSGAGVLTFVILFTLWTNSASPSEAGHNSEPVAPLQSTNPAPQAATYNTGSNYSEEVRDSLQGFYLEEAEAKKPTGRCPASGIDEKLLSWIKSEEPKVMLAIVPDPVHTHLSLFFDRQIDAIQQAAQDNGYYFDRAIMPWDSREHPESTDFRLRLQLEQRQYCREREPGLMIFRPAMYGDKRAGKNQNENGKPNKNIVNTSLYHGALLVFVVGETPTSGIRKDQFEEAVRVIRKVRSNDPPGQPLRILGPTFSGSLFSLRRLIESHKNDKEKFSEFLIYSGTANSDQSIKQFLESDNAQPKTKTTFASFQESAELQELLFVRFLLERGYAARNIAILSEDETAYGGFETNYKKPEDVGASVDFANSPGDSNEGNEENFRCFWNCPKPTDEDKSYEQIQKSVVHVYFPREIAQLRSAYQREEVTPRYGGSDKESPRVTLKRDLTDSGSDDDSVQTYSHRQLPLSQEGVLLGIVTTLDKHGIEFVILRATDPLDEVFLARYLRSTSPNLCVVTAGNDLLLRREIDDRLLFGILSINTYSMRPGANDLLPNPSSWPVHQERVFPGPDSVGTYNAMTALLWLDKPPEDKKGASPNRDACVPEPGKDERLGLSCWVGLQEYGWPSLGGPLTNGTSEAPPVWVTVLGRDGFWPVTLLEPGSDPKDPVSRLPLLKQGSLRPREGPNPPATWAWRALCGFLVVLAILYICLLCGGSALSTSQASQQLAMRGDDCRWLVFAIQGLLLLAALLLVLWPWLHGRVNGCWLWGFGLGATAVALLVVVVNDLRQRRSDAPPFGTVVAALILALAFVGMLWHLFRFLGDGDPVTNMFIYRYVHAAWWVSPLVPVLLLVGAGLWWSWHTIQGATLLDERRPSLPTAQSGTSKGVHAKALPDLCTRTVAPQEQLEGPSSGDLAQPEAGILSSELKRLCEDEPEVKRLIEILTPGKWIPRVHWAVVAFVGLAVSLSDYYHPVSSLEGQWYDRIFGILLLVALGALFSSLIRLYFIWMDAKRLLIRLDGTRLRYGFGRLPGYAWMPFWGLGASPLPDRERLARLEVEALQTAVATVDGPGKPEFKKCLDDVRAAVETLQGDLDSKSKGADPLKHVKDLYDKIAIAARAMLKYLSKKWEEEPYEDPKNIVGRKETEFHCHCHPITEESARERSKNATKAAEDFVALVYASFIQVVLIRIRSLIICACGMFVFIVASLHVYPFGQKGSLDSLSILLLLVIVGVIVLVFSQIRRDATLSHITDTTAGQLGTDFWLKLAQFGALPLLSLLTTLYPEVGTFLFSWLEPALRALGH
jgi:hypothetical protein